MNPKIFSNIGKILERDSKSSTYKFALLRGVIDIIQDNSPYIYFGNGRAHFPTGLLIEKWMLYYYPILESPAIIPQINGENIDLAFASEFKRVIDGYRHTGGFSSFYNDLKNKGIPKTLAKPFYALAKKIRQTITRMPMKYIGRSISDEYYSIFHYECPLTRVRPSIDLQFLVDTFGTFSIPVEYYEAFKVLGSFINGQDALLFKWAEFSVNASGKRLSIEKVINEVLRSPITDRDILESKKIYASILRQEGKVRCVWTGNVITSYDIDHVVPFSIWKNNDLWNLLPARASINNLKRDKIPSAKLIEERKEEIVRYWDLVQETQRERFQKEIQVTLLGQHPFSSWKETAIPQLKRTCDYLISERGFMEWTL
jgi:hypothetical protein